MITLYIVKSAAGWDPESELLATTSWAEVLEELAKATISKPDQWYYYGVDRYEIADNGRVFQSSNRCEWALVSGAPSRKAYSPTPTEWSPA